MARLIGYWLLLSLAVGLGVLSYIYAPKLLGKGDAVFDVFVTLYSILAGFIVAVMTLLGDGAAGAIGWRRARLDATVSLRRLDRQQQLFWLYLVSVTFIIGARLAKDKFPQVGGQLDRIALGLCICALVLSYGLPIALRGAQLTKLRSSVAEAKTKASIIERN